MNTNIHPLGYYTTNAQEPASSFTPVNFAVEPSVPMSYFKDALDKWIYAQVKIERLSERIVELERQLAERNG